MAINDAMLAKQVWRLVNDTKVMFGNSFYFLFSKTCFWEYKEKTIFLYFWNQKHIWLFEIKKIFFWKKKKKKIPKYVVTRIWNLI